MYIYSYDDYMYSNTGSINHNAFCCIWFQLNGKYFVILLNLKRRSNSSAFKVSMTGISSVGDTLEIPSLAILLYSTFIFTYNILIAGDTIDTNSNGEQQYDVNKKKNAKE